MALGKNPTVIGSCETCSGTQTDLGGGLPDTTLLVFWIEDTGDVCVQQEVIDPDHLSVVNGQMECPGGSKSGKVSGGFCQPRIVLLAGLTSSHGFWTQLDILHR